MGKVLGLLIGTAAVVAGLYLLVAWRGEFLAVLKGVMPVVFILGGGIAVMSGFSEWKDSLKGPDREGP